MARRMVMQVACDFCGYGGSLSKPEDFTRDGSGHDLCKWCIDSSRPAAWTECGGHRTTFTDDMADWSCSCGQTLASAFGHVSPPLLAAQFPTVEVPHRLATLHGEGYTIDTDGTVRWVGAS